VEGTRDSEGRAEAEPRAVKPREWKFLRTKFVLHFILFSSRDYDGRLLSLSLNGVIYLFTLNVMKTIHFYHFC
jgi:hypothetical protein